MRLFMEVQEVLYASKAPAQWLRTHTAKSLIAEREKETVRICTVKKRGWY